MKKASIISYSAGPILVSAIGFILVPILSWWLTADDMAKFAMFQISANFFILVVILGLDQALVREFNEAKSRTALLRKIVLLVFISAPIGIMGLWIVKANAHETLSRSVSAPMALACVLMLFNRVFNSFIRMSGNGLAFAIDIAAPKLIQLSVIVIASSSSIFILTYEFVINVIIGSALCALLYEIIMIYRFAQSLQLESADFQKKTPRYVDLLKFGIPLVPGALAFYAISASAVYIVGMNDDPIEMVTISLAISVGSGLAILGSVFSTLWAPFAYRWHAKSRSPLLYGHVATIVIMACSTVLLIMLFVVPYFSSLFPDRYSNVSRLVVLVAVWNLLYLVSIVGSFGVGVKRVSLSSMAVSIIGAMISISMSVVANLHFGATGVLVSVLFAFFVTLILNCELSSWNWYRIISVRHYLMIIVMSVAAIAFSLGHAWQSQILLVFGIISYIPSFKVGVSNANALIKHSAG